MSAVIYTGPCKHDGKPPDNVKKHDYGTAFCPKCKASLGPDGKWRVLRGKAR